MLSPLIPTGRHCTVEPLERRQLLHGDVTGVIFHDMNADGVRDPGEAGLANRYAYLDYNHNGTREPGEHAIPTDVDGRYRFINLNNGNYRIRHYRGGDYFLRTTPDAGRIVSVTHGGSAHGGNEHGGNDLGVVTAANIEQRIGTIYGQVFADSDRNGLLAESEPAVAARIVYLDFVNDNRFDGDEPFVMTNDRGEYLFRALPLGRYRVRQAVGPMVDKTSPAEGQIRVVTAATGVMANFGIAPATTPPPTDPPPTEPPPTEPPPANGLAAPHVTEPPGLTSAYEVHMVSQPMDHPTLEHISTDWTIWDLSGAAPERVWSAYGITGAKKLHVHFGDGNFEGSRAGSTFLKQDAPHELRVRYRTSATDPALQYTPVAVKPFRTEARLEAPAGSPEWTVDVAGYVVEEVATGFSMPVRIAFVPEALLGHGPADPLFYVAELYGGIKVVSNDGTVSTYADNILNYDPSASFPGAGEQGVTGLTVDPANGDLIVSHVFDRPDDGADLLHGIVERFTSPDGGKTLGTRQSLLVFPHPTLESHTISNTSFGPDGKLYIHAGDSFSPERAHQMDTLHGKIVRMNPDGSAPADNPFYDASNGTGGTEDYIFALGLRNPFGGDWRHADNKLYSVVNGPTVDNLIRIERARNYGWDGTDASMSNFALHRWTDTQSPIDMAFVQTSTFNGSQMPASDQDTAFVSLSGPSISEGPQQRGKKLVQLRFNAQGDVVGETVIARYTGTGYGNAAGVAAGPDGVYFTTLAGETGVTDPTAKVMRIRYVG